MAKKSRVGLDFQVWVEDLPRDILSLATYSSFNKSSSLVFQSGFSHTKKKRKKGICTSGFGMGCLKQTYKFREWFDC